MGCGRVVAEFAPGAALPQQVPARVCVLEDRVVAHGTLPFE
jgi:hypothetical protein